MSIFQHFPHREETARELAEARREKEFSEAAAEAEKGEAGAERRKALALAEQLKDRDRKIREMQTELDAARSSQAVAAGQHHRGSPTPSQLSQFSMNGSAAEQFNWPVSRRKHFFYVRCMLNVVRY